MVDESRRIDSVPLWFEGLRMNFAENLLYTRRRTDPTGYRGTIGKEDSKVAVTEVREGVTAIREITWRQLRAEAGRLASAMKAKGVRKGDRIVIIAANSLETFYVYLAATWLGAIFSSSSTDMGVKGILQRTVQINPRFIFMDDAALYNGKKIDLRQKVTDVVNGMGGCDQFKGMVVMKRWAKPLDVSAVPRSETFDSYLKAASYPPPDFVRIGFNDPFLLAFSSGTTGIPKAIVHGVGGVLLNYYKEGRLHHELGPNDVTLQYTTTGWIMYLANVGQLLFGARGVFYDGSPFQPDLTTFIKLVGDQKVTKLGISPRFLFELAKNGISPREITDLSNLQAVTSTGMVLSDQLFEWFYEKGFPAKVHLCNISGGTDIVSRKMPIYRTFNILPLTRSTLGRLLRYREPPDARLPRWSAGPESRDTHRCVRLSAAAGSWTQRAGRSCRRARGDGNVP